MTPETATRIAKSLSKASWTTFVHFSGRGEPWLHPKLMDLVATFRAQLPRNYFLLTSNGIVLANLNRDQQIRQALEGAFQSGLDTVAISGYRGVPAVEQIQRATAGASLGFQVCEYPQDLTANPNRRRVGKSLVLVAPIDGTSIGTQSRRMLCNRCGAAGPLTPLTARLRCARPFRQMSVKWSGRCVICCNDYREVLTVGDIHHTSLQDIWSRSPVLMAARQLLLQGQRTFPPCYGCDHRSFRVGLLPDRRGQATMPLPTDNCRQVLIREATKAPKELVKLRVWELNDGWPGTLL